MSSFSLLNWNVRGLNNRARRWAVQSLVTQARCSLLCLQETKKENIDAAMLAEITGPRLSGSLVLPAVGTRGGALIAWDDSCFLAAPLDTSPFAISILVKPRLGGAAWTLTSVYGPADDALKPAFLQDLSRLKGLLQGPWLIVGDFNLIYEARDKSNNNLNLPAMARFRAALDDCELKEIKLAGR